MSNKLSTEEQLSALAALAAGITAEATTWRTWREKFAAHAAAEDGRDKHRESIAASEATIAQDVHELAMRVRVRLHELCEETGALPSTNGDTNP